LDNQTAIPQQRASTTKSPGFRRKAGSILTHLLVRLLAKTPVTPDAITWFGFFVTIGAALLIATNYLFIAGFVVLIAGFFDMLDGALARETDRVTRFGGILDSTVDRLSEAVLLLGIIIFYVRVGYFPGILLASIALPASALVSYIRARAEALNIDCEVGLFTRTERVIVLALGLLLSQVGYSFLVAALGIIVFFSFVTVVQRLLHVRRQAKN